MIHLLSAIGIILLLVKLKENDSYEHTLLMLAR
nr:MAG TPA: hypothetical protein [Caudoviricetes sp.]DAV90648.1 MAG TPA: hypothetical protein [Caudoviricetes sp.]DAX86645.1 MAG TPA: hypothetical protein [Caudoviricetes sp.]